MCPGDNSDDEQSFIERQDNFYHDHKGRKPVEAASQRPDYGRRKYLPLFDCAIQIIRIIGRITLFEILFMFVYWASAGNRKLVSALLRIKPRYIPVYCNRLYTKITRIIKDILLLLPVVKYLSKGH